ncbi:glycerol-3-phosphate 1-O-acyltransferase PlsB [Candidatus Providencia siddallii]|uniref:Glycerol-3-phosphate acyltransferase n=1 Tax=Candidatus Providencia siddallii TaxID=1715285 RepID=A0ABM9NPZ0_9GAMM
MFIFQKLYFNILNLLIKILIKVKNIPLNPIKTFRIDVNKPILYILPYYSKFNLFILQHQCKIIGLQDPFHNNTINKIKLPAHIFIYKNIFNKNLFLKPNKNSINIFNKYLKLYKKNLNIDIQILYIFTTFGRSYKKEKKHITIIPLNFLKKLKKLFTILWLGRDCFIIFSPIFSIKKLIKRHDINTTIINKLIRFSKIYYLRQQQSIIGPKLLNKKKLFNKILFSNVIKKSIIDESINKKISIKKAKKNAINILKEISSDFSYEIIRLTNKILKLFFKIIYKKINVNNIENIRQLTQNGYKIIYVPSHRSHMDYLLISYVLYNEGLSIPHIAAGINLNFWPIGNIFRKLGAFFIRRTFQANKLYSNIFREYLSELFIQGYSIEYFIEGSRSRTGRLLKPKTGILSITLQTMLQKKLSQIIFIPIYISYEQIIEIDNYTKELNGKKKQKENILSIINSFNKLKRLGECYINFSEPIFLSQFLNKYITNQNYLFNKLEKNRPPWLNHATNLLATNIMININKTTTINSINLISNIILSTLYEQIIINEQLIIEQIKCYLKLFNNVPYTQNTIIIYKTADEILKQIFKKNIFKQKNDINKKIKFFLQNKIPMMIYHRNNINHLLILPSLIANIILYKKNISYKNIFLKIKIIYPFLKAELFLHYNNKTLYKAINDLINELKNQKIIFFNKKKQITINLYKINILKILANNACEILQHYSITLFLLYKNPKINQNDLKKNSIKLSQHISILHGIYTQSFFDKTIFFIFINTLREKKYINNKKDIFLIKIHKLYLLLSHLIPNKIKLTIESSNNF